MTEAEIIILLVIVLFALFFGFLLYKIIQIRKKKPSIGRFAGETATVIDRITPDTPGFIRFQGEYWKAKADTIIEPDTKVVIIEKDETMLIVKPVEKQTKH